MRTKQQTDSILKWILDNENIQITYCGETYRDCDYSEVFTQLSCEGTSAEFRIKQRNSDLTVLIDSFYFDQQNLQSPLEMSVVIKIPQGFHGEFQQLSINRTPLRLISEQCYNNLLVN